MRCSSNDFCRSLDDESRAALCAGCRKRLLRAGSMEVFERVVDKSLIVLDGAYLSFADEGLPSSATHEPPFFTFCMPGRLLSQDVLFGIQPNKPLPYIASRCLTDCRIAAFDHEFILRLYADNPAFARKVNESAVMIMFDQAKIAGILRTEGIFAKVMLLIRYLLSFELFISNNDIAFVLACDRTSVSRAITRVRSEHPELWRSYVANRHRPIELHGA